MIKYFFIFEKRQELVPHNYGPTPNQSNRHCKII